MDLYVLNNRKIITHFSSDPIDTQFDHVFSRWIDDWFSCAILWINDAVQNNGYVQIIYLYCVKRIMPMKNSTTV